MPAVTTWEGRTVIDTELTAWLPTVALVAACIAAAATRGAPWFAARAGAAVALVLTLVHLLVTLAAGGAPHAGPQVVFAVLVGLLGWVVVRFSATYLQGEPGERRYVGHLLATLAAVGAIAATDHLGVMLVAWVATSVGLHHLLLFYRDRPDAHLAAHKKFVASRLSEVALALALVLIYRETGTLHLDALATYATGRESLPAGMHAAMVLIAVAALIKCAQVPMHGWLIQVMEAPTPVSALLHAGIVNVAGFVLIRLGDVLALAPVARGLLVVVGGLSALVAGLVMLTRVSIKVRLAWSTCAQMGFMLVECGLGLYELALLHLVAHSLYKAHAFLTAGETVARVRQRDLWRADGAGSRERPRPGIAIFGAVALVTGTTGLWHLAGSGALPWIAIVILATGLAPLLWHDAVAGAVRIVGLSSLYVVWHQLFSALLPSAVPAHAGLALFAAACFVALYFLQFWLVHRSSSPLARALYPWAYYGFYADERFTRFALRLWPLPAGGGRPEAVPARHIEETP